MSQVTVRGAWNLVQVVDTGNHALVADEPEADGGNGLGPPYGLLLASSGPARP